MLTQESITRKDFLRSMGLGGSALLAVLASCKNASDVVFPVGGITVDLSTKTIDELQSSIQDLTGKLTFAHRSGKEFLVNQIGRVMIIFK